MTIDEDWLHPQVRIQMLWWVECTLCGTESFNGVVPRFDSEEQMWVEMLDPLGYAWSRKDDGRVLCRWHTAVADCDRWGHQPALWTEHPIADDMVWRYCGRCGADFEERIVTQPGV